MATRLGWGKIFRIAASAGFAASAALHLATFTPFPLAAAAALALLLFVVAFVLLAVMVVRLREASAPTRGEGALRVVQWRRRLGLVPVGPRRARLAVMAYVVLNLALSLVASGDSAGCGSCSGTCCSSPRFR